MIKGWLERARDDALPGVTMDGILALNLLKQEKTKKRGIKGKQLHASRDHACLLRLLGI